MASEPMDIDVDPVDGGPKPTATGTGLNDPMAQEQPPPPHITVVSTGAASSSAAATSAEEEARQAIDMLHGDDVGNRVAAAHRLESVAAALGPERTREVCLLCYGLIQLARLDEITVLYSDGCAVAVAVYHVHLTFAFNNCLIPGTPSLFNRRSRRRRRSPVGHGRLFGTLGGARGWPHVRSRLAPTLGITLDGGRNVGSRGGIELSASNRLALARRNLSTGLRGHVGPIGSQRMVHGANFGRGVDCGGVYATGGYRAAR